MHQETIHLDLQQEQSLFMSREGGKREKSTVSYLRQTVISAWGICKLSLVKESQYTVLLVYLFKSFFFRNDSILAKSAVEKNMFRLTCKAVVQHLQHMVYFN